MGVASPVTTILNCVALGVSKSADHVFATDITADAILMSDAGGCAVSFWYSRSYKITLYIQVWTTAELIPCETASDKNNLLSDSNVFRGVDIMTSTVDTLSLACRSSRRATCLRSAILVITAHGAARVSRSVNSSTS